MAEMSRGRGVFGRLLTALGLAWVFWGFFGPVIGRQFGNSFVDLPPLPGIVIFFIGRALTRGGGRGESRPQQDTRPEAQAPPRLEPPVRPAPAPERTTQELRPVAEPVALSEVMLEAPPEGSEPDLPVSDAVAIRKTSAEMVAEARKRYGRRP
jgi:hypothetical protein